jgi:outer membrane lipoprotein-sorting protein
MTVDKAPPPTTMGPALSVRTLSIIGILLLLAAGAAGSQEILSAEKFLDAVSQQFGAITDMEADIAFTQSGTTWRGTLSYRTPLYLRIDFSNPKGQFIAIDAEQLVIYVPSLNVVMVQALKHRSSGQLAEMVTAKGLGMLARNFSVAWETGPDPVPLESGSSEMVYKLKLTPRVASTGFRSMTLSVARDRVFRRLEGVRADGERQVLDYLSVRINQNLPDQRFRIDTPPDANIIPDFLFDPEE